MKCYLAGPMRGIPEYNFPAFFAAAEQLKKLGHEVWNPAEHDVKLDNFNPKTDAVKDLKYYMKRDLPAVLESDAVVVLPGWEESGGAKLETRVAMTCGISVYDLDDILSSKFLVSIQYK